MVKVYIENIEWNSDWYSLINEGKNSIFNLKEVFLFSKLLVLYLSKINNRLGKSVNQYDKY